MFRKHQTRWLKHTAIQFWVQNSNLNIHNVHHIWYILYQDWLSLYVYIYIYTDVSLSLSIYKYILIYIILLYSFDVISKMDLKVTMVKTPGGASNHGGKWLREPTVTNGVRSRRTIPLTNLHPQLYAIYIYIYIYICIL